MRNVAEAPCCCCNFCLMLVLMLLLLLLLLFGVGGSYSYGGFVFICAVLISGTDKWYLIPMLLLDVDSVVISGSF